MLRYVLGQAGQIAARADPDRQRLYSTVRHRHGRAMAKMATGRANLTLGAMLPGGVDPQGAWSSAGVPELSMVAVRTDNLIETPTLDDPGIVDNRTRHHAPRVRE